MAERFWYRIECCLIFIFEIPFRYNLQDINSYYPIDDYSDESSEESEDEISAKIDSISNVCQETSDGFSLGIDCDEICRGMSTSIGLLRKGRVGTYFASAVCYKPKYLIFICTLNNGCKFYSKILTVLRSR